MFTLRLLALLAVAFLIVSAVVSAKKGKKGKKEDQVLEKLTDEVSKLNDRVKHLEEVSSTDDEYPEGSKLHVFFHGDNHEVEHSDAEVFNVHVDLDDDHHARHHMEEHDGHHMHEAHCEFGNGEDQGIKGHVHMMQEDMEKEAHFMVKFDFLSTESGEHEVHVHMNGDLSNGCDSLGDHYNGGDEGVIGLLTPEVGGAVPSVWFNETGLDLHEVMGRSVKVHAPNHDWLACCVVGWSKEMDHDEHQGHGVHHGGHGSHHAADKDDLVMHFDDHSGH